MHQLFLVPLFLSDLGETCDVNADGFAAEAGKKTLHLLLAFVREGTIHQPWKLRYDLLCSATRVLFFLPQRWES